MRMLKTLFAFVGIAVATMVATVVAPTVAKADWIAVAVNDYGYGASSGYDEEDARSNAIEACENETGRSCYDQTVSVPRHWYLVAISCNNGYNSVGASKYNYHTAKQIAANKIYGCRRFSTMASF